MNILITGGTSGLGKALVELLTVEPGNEIYFTYRDSKDQADLLMSTHCNVHAFQVDYCDEDHVDQFTAQLSKMEIDVLVNNAYSGFAMGTHFHKTAADDFEMAFKNNIIPTVKITQACLSGMRKRRFGKIVNVITSYVIDVPPAGFSVYTATKAYLRQISRSISGEYARYNITSNCILPDYMATPFGRVEDFQMEQMILSHPLKRLLLPAEAAEIVRFVINSSQQLNGAEIPVNAGQHLI